MSTVTLDDNSRNQLDRLWHNPHYDRRKSMGVVNRRHMGVGGRRASENVAANTYVDLYDKSLAIKAFLLVLLSTLDAGFTQILIGAGAQELNGVVSHLLVSSGSLFVAIKVGVTGLAAVFLVIHHNFIIFRVLQVRVLLRGLVGLYGLLVVYELYLMARFVI